ncbi:MAG: glycine betaine ABC transporter substrate-binding protein [Phycisphaerae bacterium]
MLTRCNTNADSPRLLRLMVFVATFFAITSPVAEASDTVRIGAKNFTEQEILGELVAQLIEQHTNLRVERRFGLGGTGVCHAALVSGELDIYVEYTGTALLNVLRQPAQTDADKVFQMVSRAYRGRFNLEWLPPMGFSNTYAIAVRAADADARDWRAISDLAHASSDLTGGFTSEFMERPDGFPGLRSAYGLEFGRTADLDPGLMYKALADGQVDVICAFATDGRIAAYKLRILDDDRSFFPPYDAAPVIRSDLLRNHPEIRDALTPLAGTIDDREMRRLNFAVDELKQRPSAVARGWIGARGSGHQQSVAAPTSRQADGTKGFWAMAVSRRAELWRKTLEHLWLTALAMGIAVLIGVPLGVLVYRNRKVAPLVLGVTEIVQTIPSLAMLAFLFTVYGILGTTPAVTALVLYALLPIVVNTFTGLKELRPDLIEAANGVGMSPQQRLRMVELPLALPMIVAGVRTSTVWTVGIATLSTYIGAGGLGDFISRGLARNDPRLTLLGAVPAAMMAVSLSLCLRFVERRLGRV